MKEVGEKLGFGCVSIPDAPWDCIYTLPQEYRCMLVQELKTLDPIAGMNMVEVLNKFSGSAVACGNLDCGLMISGTPQEVYESARQILINCKGKGIIFGNSNAVVLETPLENYMAMHSAWIQFG